VSDDKELDVLDLPDEVRALVAECEVTGRRTAFTRKGRPVVMLTSYDEYLALRETVEIVSDGAFLARVTAAEEQVKRGAMVLVEDLMWNDRLRIAESVQAEWKALGEDDRALVRNALQTIDDDPIAGAPLFDPLGGLWSFRAGSVRIVYRIMSEARFVVILFIARAEEKKRT